MAQQIPEATVNLVADAVADYEPSSAGLLSTRTLLIALGVVLAGLAMWWFMRRRKRQHDKKAAQAAQDEDDSAQIVEEEEPKKKARKSVTIAEPPVQDAPNPDDA